MPVPPPQPFLPRPSVRLDPLLRLRWLSAIGQLAALFIVVMQLEFDLPLGACLAVIGFSVLLNIALQIRFHRMAGLTNTQAGLLLAVNVAELAALLFLTGGLQNPFAFLFLAPVLISATALPPRLTLMIGGFAIVCATILVFAHYPLPWYTEDPLELPPLYKAGVWVSTVLAIGLTSLYAFQVTDQARQLADALAAAEFTLAREQHLSQLDGLAAAAAHELGTPLSTISVVARELERALGAESPLAADARLLREQAQRCGIILSKLTELSVEGAPFDSMKLSALIEEVVAPHRQTGVLLQVVMPAGAGPEPIAPRNPGILYGLGNLVENAVDFAKNAVAVIADWDAEKVSLAIHDDGPGFAPAVLARIGAPYVVSRRRRQRGGDEDTGGLGLGLFIAKTLLERSGATIAFRNQAFPAHGAIVEVTWPRAEFERKDAAPALLGQNEAFEDADRILPAEAGLGTNPPPATV